MNYARLFTKVVNQFTGICTIILYPKKHVLTHVVLLVDYPQLIIIVSAFLRYYFVQLDCDGYYGNEPAASVFFNLRIVSRSAAELSTSIGTLMG